MVSASRLGYDLVMIRPLIPALGLLIVSAAAASAGDLQCTPRDTSARILASADAEDPHPDWEGSSIGLAWTFIVSGKETEDGVAYYAGELIDPRGNTVSDDAYIIASEWDCSR